MIFGPRQNLWQQFSSLINDCWFRLQIRPYAEATASIQGYLSVLYVIRAGVSGDGTIVDVGLPMTLSLQVYPYNQWCATVSADLTALKLTARVYYQWCWFLGCGSRNTLFRLGSWSAISWNRNLIQHCGYPVWVNFFTIVDMLKELIIHKQKDRQMGGMGWDKLVLCPLEGETENSL